MKLRAIDQVHISSVQADSLRPGQEFEVSDELGAKMLKSLPGQVEEVASEPFGGKGDHDDNGEAGGVAPPAEKAEPEHANKAIISAPANKSRKTKGK